MSKIRILLVDDHAIVRQGLRLMLESQAEFEIISEAENGQVAIEHVLELKPDVLLLDLLMPDMNGIQVIEALKAKGSTCRILILTSTLEDRMVQQAIEAGANGYALKASHADDLIDAIRRTANNENVLDPAAVQVVMSVLRQSKSPLENLTPREEEIFYILAKGHNNREIADMLTLSENTVRTHIANLLEKLNLRDRVQVMVFALKNGLIEPEDLP